MNIHSPFCIKSLYIKYLHECTVPTLLIGVIFPGCPSRERDLRSRHRSVGGRWMCHTPWSYLRRQTQTGVNFGAVAIGKPALMCNNELQIFFQEKISQQLDDVAMGNSVEPALTGIYVTTSERKLSRVLQICGNFWLLSLRHRNILANKISKDLHNEISASQRKGGALMNSRWGMCTISGELTFLTDMLLSNGHSEPFI